MKKAWATTRNWERSKAEVKFEELLQTNGYTIEGYREYQSKTDYKITKNDISVEWSVPHLPAVDVNGLFKSFVQYHQLTAECLELKKKTAECLRLKAELKEDAQ